MEASSLDPEPRNFKAGGYPTAALDPGAAPIST